MSATASIAWRLALGIALALCAPVADAAAGPNALRVNDAAKGAGLRLERAVFSGGGESGGGGFRVRGTIGQADTDPLQPATGGNFALSGGFWPGVAPPPPAGDAVFANGFE